MSEEQRQALGDTLARLQRGQITGAEAIERVILALLTGDDIGRHNAVVVPLTSWKGFSHG